MANSLIHDFEDKVVIQETSEEPKQPKNEHKETESYFINECYTAQDLKQMIEVEFRLGQNGKIKKCDWTRDGKKLRVTVQYGLVIKTFTFKAHISNDKTYVNRRSFNYFANKTLNTMTDDLKDLVES